MVEKIEEYTEVMKFFFFIFISLITFSLVSCSSDNDFIDDMAKIGRIEMINVISDLDVNDSLRIKENPDIEVEFFFSYSTKATTSNQGFAIFENKMFQCYHTNNIIDIIDLDIKKVVESIYLEPDELAHCNTVSFGPFFYDGSDKYPLLYIQQRGSARKLDVYRLRSESDSTFSSQKVQLLSFISCETSLSAIDINKNAFYVLFFLKGRKYIATFNIPDFHNKNLVLDVKDALCITYLPEMKIIQDTATDGKYLYFLCGYSKEGELWQINMDTKEARVIDLPSYNLKGEPEGIDCYEDGLLVSFLGRAVYKIKIL